MPQLVLAKLVAVLANLLANGPQMVLRLVLQKQQVQQAQAKGVLAKQLLAKMAKMLSLCISLVSWSPQCSAAGAEALRSFVKLASGQRELGRGIAPRATSSSCSSLGASAMAYTCICQAARRRPAAILSRGNLLWS